MKHNDNNLPLLMNMPQYPPSFSDTWVCTPQCSKSGSDDLFEYTRALLWRGLGHLARHRSIRQNDGPAMIANWKIDMLDFWQLNHSKYLIIGHRLLAGAVRFLTHVWKFPTH